MLLAVSHRVNINQAQVPREIISDSVMYKRTEDFYLKLTCGNIVMIVTRIFLKFGKIDAEQLKIFIILYHFVDVNINDLIFFVLIGVHTYSC